MKVSISKRVAVLTITGLLVSCGGSGSGSGNLGGDDNAYVYTMPRQFNDGWTAGDASTEAVDVGTLTNMMANISSNG
jgi:hypothetical protein